MVETKDKKNKPGMVLVIEDDNDIRESIIQALELIGIRSEGASNGQEALDRLATISRPDLIFLDLMMPIMSGEQFRQKQLLDQKIADIPVVVFTADGHAVQKAKDLGVCEGIPKPVQLEDVHRAAKKYLGIR